MSVSGKARHQSCVSPTSHSNCSRLSRRVVLDRSCTTSASLASAVRVPFVAQSSIIFISAAIGAIYSVALERSGRARVTAVCRCVSSIWNCSYWSQSLHQCAKVQTTISSLVSRPCEGVNWMHCPTDSDVERLYLEHGLEIDSSSVGKATGWRPYRGVLIPQPRPRRSTLTLHLPQSSEPLRVPLTGGTHISSAVSSEFHAPNLNFTRPVNSDPLGITHTRVLPDVQPAPELLASLLNCTSTFVLLQNGVGIERDFQRAVPHATVISGCAWIDCTSVDEGRKVLHVSFVCV